MHMRNFLIALFFAVSFLCALVQTMPISSSMKNSIDLMRRNEILDGLIKDLLSRITAHVPTTEYKTKEAHYQYLIQFDPTNYDHDLPLSIKVWHMVNRDGHKLGLLQWPLDVHDKMIADVVMHTNPSHDVLAHCQDTCYEQIEHLLIDKKEWARRWKLCQFRCLMDKATGFTHLPCKKPE